MFLELLTPGTVGCAVGEEQGIAGGEGIEHGELALGGEERLVVVRAVEVYEALADPLEQGEGDRRVVDELPVG